MCVIFQMGEQIATLDSMSHKSIFNEYLNTIQPYLFISVIIILKKSGIHMFKKNRIVDDQGSVILLRNRISQ